jgi:hypothetical protein
MSNIDVKESEDDMDDILNQMMNNLKNNNINRDSLLNSHMVMCDCVTNNNNIKHKVPTNYQG